MITQTTTNKQKQMIEVIGKIIAESLKPKGKIAVPSNQNNTVVIKDYNQKYLYTIVIFDLGTDYNLVINDEVFEFSVEELLMNKSEVIQDISNWITCINTKNQYLKIAKNQKIVNYLNSLFEFESNLIGFKLNSIHPEILVNIGSNAGTIVFGIRQNGACFILKDIETNQTITVNYADHLIGINNSDQLKKWLIDKILA